MLSVKGHASMKYSSRAVATAKAVFLHRMGAASKVYSPRIPMAVKLLMPVSIGYVRIDHCGLKYTSNPPTPA